MDCRRERRGTPSAIRGLPPKVYGKRIQPAATMPPHPDYVPEDFARLFAVSFKISKTSKGAFE
jgi:hypothetical protein